MHGSISPPGGAPRSTGREGRERRGKWSYSGGVRVTRGRSLHQVATWKHSGNPAAPWKIGPNFNPRKGNWSSPKKHFVGVNVSFRECHQDRSCWCIHFVVPFPRMPVTTRIFSCWLGDPNLNLVFATITRKGDNPRCLCLRNEKIRCFLPTWWCFDS